jgi:thiosulfate dehydrogenase [quinone] large subunit
MTTPRTPTAGRPVLRSDDAFLADPVHEETPRHTAYRFTLAITRLSIGWVFVWAFLDKTFGLGHETLSKAAWINGGSPTKGFLSNASTGPFTSFYKDIAGATWADWLFMWTAVLPPANNPFMDDHLVYAIVLVLLALTAAGKTLGLGRRWERIPLVSRHGILK